MHKIYTSWPNERNIWRWRGRFIIKSDGLNDYKDILNEYFKYDSNIFNSFHSLKKNNRERFKKIY